MNVVEYIEGDSGLADAGVSDNHVAPPFFLQSLIAAQQLVKYGSGSGIDEETLVKPNVAHFYDSIHFLCRFVVETKVEGSMARNAAYVLGRLREM